MLKSMTGYGRGTKELGTLHITVEVKSVNHRFSDIAIRLPRQLLHLEEKVRQRIVHYIKRGRVEAFVTLEGLDVVNRLLHIDWSLFDQYVTAYEQAAERYNGAERFPISALLNNPDVFQIIERENVPDHVEEAVISALDEALIDLLHMRQEEGKTIITDFQKRLQLISEAIVAIQQKAQQTAPAYRQKLLHKVNEFLAGNYNIEESRILTEVAIFADKSDINEELQRLRGHVEHFQKILKESEEPIGRKLDFLAQEMNREANTIGSKSTDLFISEQVVELKTEIEKLKEQAQNVE